MRRESRSREKEEEKKGNENGKGREGREKLGQSGIAGR